ncbi:hypothetical protein AAW14_08635 [Streptomyces hygroscopicus]|uniref:hypothetical protein n=1 Tax=Streptomyces hygroscopicus TaxID=1912 RepID=UPI00223F2D74|nr:hypothetical protein [Streptomyces hygroscopicus]MCW7942100.1 hypothetical protein [Streptomyces hygroscopicus]
MTVDPTDPATFKDFEDIEDVEDLEDIEDDAVDLDVEAPENDAAAQHTEVAPPPRDEPLTEEEILRANEADLVEQKRVVTLDDDDYR